MVIIVGKNDRKRERRIERVKLRKRVRYKGFLSGWFSFPITITIGAEEDEAGAQNSVQVFLMCLRLPASLSGSWKGKQS